MALVDPTTGLPLKSEFTISNDDLIKVLTAQRMKIDLLNQQNMQLGLYLEYIVEHLLAMEAADGTPLFAMDIEGFQPWAEKRLKQIQDELAAQQAQAATTDAESLLNQLPEGLGTPIDLDE